VDGNSIILDYHARTPTITHTNTHTNTRTHGHTHIRRYASADAVRQKDDTLVFIVALPLF